MATLFGSTERFIDTMRPARNKKAAEDKVELIKADQKSGMHRASKMAMKVVATATVQATSMNAVFAVGNGISEGLTGEPLHGAGLVATSLVATGVGLGVGIRTYVAVDETLKMVDERRLKEAEDELQTFNSSDEDIEGAVESD